MRWAVLGVLVAACTDAPAATLDAAHEPGPTSAVESTRPDADATPRDADTGAIEATRPAERELASIDLDPARGSLTEQLTLQAMRARRAGLQSYVQMRAGWCAICKRVDAQLGTAAARQKLRGVVILRVDTDVWSDELRTAGLVSPTIPTFYALDRRGRPKRELRGHGWGPSVDAVARVHAFVRG